MAKSYVADFETTTNPEKCHVWAFATCEVGNKDNVTVGLTIDEFMHWCMAQKDNPKIYFHNLKFDGQFIIYWLLTHGYKAVEESADRGTNTFKTMISDKGLWYSIEVIFYKKGKNIRKVAFQDSLKLIPLSVDAIAKSFKMDIQKLSIDYSAHDDVPEGSPITDQEKEYIIHDVQIVATAIEYFYSQGLDKMTIGACALEEYKKLIQKKNFNRYYPTPQYDADVRQSYRGGFTYLNPKFKEKTVGSGVVFDVNSLYPSVMRFCKLPYGTPIFFRGKYEEDKMFPLYVQMFSCRFKLKPNKIPTIQIKNSSFFTGNEYLTESKQGLNDDAIILCLTSVDLKLFYEQYDVFDEEWMSGWKFKGCLGLFDDYIDKWSNNKIQAKLDKNHGLYLISKLFLNSLYGKFGSGTSIKSKIPYMDDEKHVVKFYDTDPKEKDGIYIAMASFITSYAREKTIRSAQTIQDNFYSGKSNVQFVYADTDSLHCITPDFSMPIGIEIDATKLGAWKFESKFKKAKFLRQKCYIELSTENVYDEFDIEEIQTDETDADADADEIEYRIKKHLDGEYELKVTVAGMPYECHKEVNFKNFKIGATYYGKRQPKVVPGGVVLKEIDYTIKK